MAVTYKNTWNNIKVALMSKLKAEMKCPIFSGSYTESKANQFIKLISVGSVQGDVTKSSEHRTFNITIEYYIMDRKNSEFEKYVDNQVSILEALVHDNPTLSLADSTTAYNVMIGDCARNVEIEEHEDYNVSTWDLSCEHLSNLG